MFFEISGLLTSDEVAKLNALARELEIVDGRLTNQSHSGKNNLRIRGDLSNAKSPIHQPTRAASSWSNSTAAPSLSRARHAMWSSIPQPSFTRCGRSQPAAGWFQHVHREQGKDHHRRMQLYVLADVAALEAAKIGWDNRVRLEVVLENLTRMWSDT